MVKKKKTNLWLPNGTGGVGGDLELVYTHCSNTKLLVNGNSTQYSVIIYMGKEPEKELMCTHVQSSPFVVQQKLSQHCKPTILQ